jgi:hypothetical protein
MKCQCGAGMLCECNRAEGHEEPDVSQVIFEAAQMPFMMTNAQKTKLRAIGYDDNAISKMTPEQSNIGQTLFSLWVLAWFDPLWPSLKSAVA